MPSQGSSALRSGIEPDLMAKTLDITFANAKPDKPVKAEDVYTNAYSSRIKPLK